MAPSVRKMLLVLVSILWIQEAHITGCQDGDERMCRASIQGAPKPGATSSSSTPPPLSSGPWPVVAGIVYAVVAAAIMFVLYCRKPKKPNADDVEGFHSMPHDHSDEPGVDCRGNPDGGESDEILTIPVQVSDP